MQGQEAVVSALSVVLPQGGSGECSVPGSARPLPWSPAGQEWNHGRISMIIFRDAYPHGSLLGCEPGRWRRGARMHGAGAMPSTLGRRCWSDATYTQHVHDARANARSGKLARGRCPKGYNATPQCDCTIRSWRRRLVFVACCQVLQTRLLRKTFPWTRSSMELGRREGNAGFSPSHQCLLRGLVVGCVVFGILGSLRVGRVGNVPRRSSAEGGSGRQEENVIVGILKPPPVFRQLDVGRRDDGALPDLASLPLPQPQ